jgi:excisionase family DNA binding protein
MNQIQTLLTVSQFAEALRVTPACIRKWILERRIATIKVGRCVRIPDTEAARIVEAGLRPARPAKPAGRP